MNLEAIATLMGIIGTILGTFIAVSQFYRNRIKEMIERNATAGIKAYAAQREFEHLERHQQQLKENVRCLQDDLIELEKQMVELKVISTASYNRIEQVAARLDTGNSTMGGSQRSLQWNTDDEQKKTPVD